MMTREIYPGLSAANLIRFVGYSWLKKTAFPLSFEEAESPLSRFVTMTPGIIFPVFASRGITISLTGEFELVTGVSRLFLRVAVSGCAIPMATTETGNIPTRKERRMDFIAGY